MSLVSPDKFYDICDQLQDMSKSDEIAFHKKTGLPFLNRHKKDSDEINEDYEEISDKLGQFILDNAQNNPNLAFKGVEAINSLQQKCSYIEITAGKMDEINAIVQTMVKADKFIEKGKTAEKSKSFQEAKEKYEKAAELHSAKGIFKLGQLYDRKEDFKKSAELYKEAADLGYVLAQYNYAVCLKDGIGVSENLNKAYKYFALAAKQNYPDAQVSVGNFFEDGDWVRKDIVKALDYYKKAADQDNDAGKEHYERLSETHGKKQKCIIA